MAKTKWEGLWTHKGQYGTFYSGYTIKKKDIPTYTRLIIRHNKRWKKNGEKPTPRYQYCFIDAAGHEEYCRPIEFDEDDSSPYIGEDGNYYTSDGERLYTREDARRIIDGTFDDVKYGISDPYDILPEDFV